MKIDIKKLHPSAVIPTYAKDGDAGLDLVSTRKEENNLYVEYGTSLAVAIPEGYVGLLFPRSSISKYHLIMANSVGVIDSGYRGEICVRFKKTIDNSYERVYDSGDKVAQLVIIPYPKVEFNVVNNLDETERGSGGFGSSGT